MNSERDSSMTCSDERSRDYETRAPPAALLRHVVHASNVEEQLTTKTLLLNISVQTFLSTGKLIK